MADMKQLLIVVAVLVGFASAVDPRVCALRGRDLEQLKMICNKASVPFEADADEEKLRSILFEYMQNELPETIRPKGTPLEPWPGPGQPGECDDPKSMKPNPGSTPKLEHMAARLFNRLDKNSDDMLQRDEMRAMLDEINAAARAKGEPEHDLFKTLDRDQDGKVSRTEAEETFKAMAAKMMQSTSYSTPFATTPFGVMRSTPLFALTSTRCTLGRLKVGRYSSLNVGRLQNCRYQGLSASAAS
jgi:hypothetical protein